MRLLQLDLDDWPFGGLLAVLNSNYFRPAWQEGVAASVVERTVRAQQIPHGCQRLLDEVRRIPAEDSAEDGSYRSSAQRSASSDASRTAAVSLLEGLVRSFAKMPEKATLAQWSKAWRELAQATGLLRAITIGAEIGVAFRSAKERGFRGAKGDNATVIDSPSLSEGEGESQAATPEAVPDQSANPDRAAWNGLMKALAEGDRLSKWLGQHPPELDRREAFDTLLDILHSERIGQAGDECGIRASALGGQRAVAADSLSFSGRALGEGLSAARPRRPSLQRRRVPAADRRGPAAGGADRTQPRGDAAVLRGDHAGDAAAVPELSGAGRVGPAAFAQSVLEGSGTGVRRADSAHRADRSQPDPAGRRAALAKPSSASRRWRRRWRATCRCWLGCWQGPP